MIDAGRANTVAELAAIARVRGYSNPTAWAERVQAERTCQGNEKGTPPPSFFERRAANLCVSFVRPFISQAADASRASGRDEFAEALGIVTRFAIGDRPGPLDEDKIGVARLRLSLLAIELDRGGYLAGLDNCEDRADILVDGLDAAAEAAMRMYEEIATIFAKRGSAAGGKAADDEVAVSASKPDGDLDQIMPTEIGRLIITRGASGFSVRVLNHAGRFEESYPRSTVESVINAVDGLLNGRPVPMNSAR